MIKQLSGVCYEYIGGSLDVRFLNDYSTYYNPAPSARIIPFTPAPPATGERFTRAQIRPNQMIIAPILAKYGRFELCGSYRREKATVKDMDYVVETSREYFAELRAELTRAGVEFHRGANEIMNGHLNGIAVDFFRADPKSYVSILIWRTGSANHNIYCATVARRRGMRILRTGIERHGRILHPETEQDFYSILGIPYIFPNKRDME